jgi:predicted adenylyl cyclase CyaB
MNNIEIKFKVHSLDKIESRLSEQPDCQFIQTLRQRDVYFPVPKGRLKLRLQNQKDPELIFYQRENLKHPRQSNYLIYFSSNPELLGSILSEALGSDVTVVKERKLWMFRNVRIHLDRVDDLGEFLELEAVIDEKHNEQVSSRNLDDFLQKLSGFSLNPVPESYSDLLIRKDS